MAITPDEWVRRYRAGIANPRFTIDMPAEWRARWEAGTGRISDAALRDRIAPVLTLVEDCRTRVQAIADPAERAAAFVNCMQGKPI